MGRAGALPGAATLDCVEDREVGVADADRERSVRGDEPVQQSGHLRVFAIGIGSQPGA